MNDLKEKQNSEWNIVEEAQKELKRKRKSIAIHSIATNKSDKQVTAFVSR